MTPITIHTPDPGGPPGARVVRASDIYLGRWTRSRQPLWRRLARRLWG